METRTPKLRVEHIPTVLSGSQPPGHNDDLCEKASYDMCNLQEL
jgi:hypothetical protein